MRPFTPASDDQQRNVAGRVMALSEQEVEKTVRHVVEEFGNRHRNVRDLLLKRFEQVRQQVVSKKLLSEPRKLLLGACFVQEYALESAALFNPSMVWHPDQSGLPPGSKRFILSLRATGEGHISSICFRSGVVDESNTISMDKATRFATPPEVQPNPSFEKALFEDKLLDLGLVSDFEAQVLADLDGSFSLAELQRSVRYFLLHGSNRNRENETAAQGILSLADSNYEFFFSGDHDLSERIIFPSAPAEINGIEDARFVQFQDDDGSAAYHATYTAYDGKAIQPQLLSTRDFLNFQVSTLHGAEARNKGMALFPRKINGRYAMLSRQDNECNYIMFSESIHFWRGKQRILQPADPWEFVQIGNCGSPIETEAGWLVLSHGVGPVRKYSIGAFLLDLHDPTKVIGRLQAPLLSPDENERDGYVPNVVYSCGAQVHNGQLLIPYAMADYASSFTIVDLDDLLVELTG